MNVSCVKSRARSSSPARRYASRKTRSTWASYSARSARPSPARTRAMSSRSSTELAGATVILPTRGCPEGLRHNGGWGVGCGVWGPLPTSHTPRFLTPKHREPDGDTDEEGEQQGGQRSNEDVFGEVAVVQGPEPGQRLGGDDEPQGPELTDKDQGHRDGALQHPDHQAP